MHILLVRGLNSFEYEHERRTIEGYKGHFKIQGKSWPAIERGNGFVRLRPGVYDCRMSYWRDSIGQRWKSFRIFLTLEQFKTIYPEDKHHLARHRICIHAANYPHQLRGCVAPGKEAFENGVSKSREALFEMFEVLGGFEEHKSFTLEVV